MAYREDYRPGGDPLSPFPAHPEPPDWGDDVPPGLSTATFAALAIAIILLIGWCLYRVGRG